MRILAKVYGDSHTRQIHVVDSAQLYPQATETLTLRPSEATQDVHFMSQIGLQPNQYPRQQL